VLFLKFSNSKPSENNQFIAPSIFRGRETVKLLTCIYKSGLLTNTLQSLDEFCSVPPSVKAGKEAEYSTYGLGIYEGPIF